MLKEKDRPGLVRGIPPASHRRAAARARPPSAYSSHDELESYLNIRSMTRERDYDSEMIAAAENAAKLADGSAHRARAARRPCPLSDPLRRLPAMRTARPRAWR